MCVQREEIAIFDLKSSGGFHRIPTTSTRKFQWGPLPRALRVPFDALQKIAPVLDNQLRNKRWVKPTPYRTTLCLDMNVSEFVA